MCPAWFLCRVSIHSYWGDSSRFVSAGRKVGGLVMGSSACLCPVKSLLHGMPWAWHEVVLELSFTLSLESFFSWLSWHCPALVSVPCSLPSEKGWGGGGACLPVFSVHLSSGVCGHWILSISTDSLLCWAFSLLNCCCGASWMGSALPFLLFFVSFSV